MAIINRLFAVVPHVKAPVVPLASAHLHPNGDLRSVSSMAICNLARKENQSVKSVPTVPTAPIHAGMSVMHPQSD